MTSQLLFHACALLPGVMSVYLDYNATTPVAPEALDVITAALRDAWANPSSSHVAGEFTLSCVYNM